MNKHSYKQLHSFLLLWGSQTVSQLGTAMTDYAVIIWVYSQRERLQAEGVGFKVNGCVDLEKYRWDC